MAFQNIAGRLVDVIFGYDFFISYTWADGSKYAHSLCEKLKAQGFTVFLDEESTYVAITGLCSVEEL